MAEIYPVLHTSGDTPRDVEQAHVAFEQGVDGLFLINHHTDDPQVLINIYKAVRAELPDAFLGVNMLGLRVSNALKETILHSKGMPAPDALWSDYSNDPAMKEDLKEGIKVFGGVAFKYTDDYTDDPVIAAHLAGIAPDWIDVITTSGPGTGHPAPIEKLRAMKEAIQDGRELAVASGVDISNIAEARKVVDKILIATSVEKSDGIFDEGKLREITEAARQ